MSFALAISISIIFIVIFNQSAKYLFNKSVSEGASVIIAELIGAIGALLWIPVFSFNLIMPLALWGLLLIACIFYAVNDRLGAKVKKNLEVSVFSVVNKTSDVFLIIIGFLVFRQVPTLGKIIGVVLIILGQIILSYKKGKIVINKYFALGLLTNLIFSVAMSIDIGISDKLSIPVYVAIGLAVPALLIFIFERIKISTLISEFKGMNKVILTLVGLSWGSFIVMSLYAYQHGEIISVVALTSLSVLINVVVGIILFKEKENLINKIIAAIVVVAGVILTVASF